MIYPLDKQLFVQNVKVYCQIKGVKPTVACMESGAGKSLLSQIERRGIVPSVEKVQLLAQYLGVTVSQLLGEDASEISQGQPQPYLVFRYNQLPPEDQKDVMEYIEFKFTQMEKNKASE